MCVIASWLTPAAGAGAQVTGTVAVPAAAAAA